MAQTGTTDGTSKWANAVTTDTSGNVTGYYVWIPRFAYKITSGYHGIGLTYTEDEYEIEFTTQAGTIEIKFLKNATNEFADGTTGTPLTDPTQVTYTNGVQNEWLVHPAFLSDATIGGGFGSKSGSRDGITGFWVAKYEMSAFIGTNTSATRSIGNISAEQQIKICSLPNVQSSNNMKIGTMYDLSYNLNRNLDSHMLKNSEWGAVAYLAHSGYGRNGNEMYINNSGTGITGNSGGSTSASKADGTTYAYDTENGMKASTTGNMYGVYDMAGGTDEYVAAYVNSENSSLNHSNILKK